LIALARPLSRPIGGAARNDGLEAAKWIALALMTMNHALIGQQEPLRTIGYIAGRPCIAVFASLLTLRLAQVPEGGAARAAKRLLIFGVIAEPVYLALVWRLQLRLDILFGLAAGVALIGLIRARRPAAAAALAVALIPVGAFIEGGCLTPLAMAAGAWAERRRKGAGVLLITLACAGAALLEAPDLPLSAAAVLAAPLMIAASRRLPAAPRLPGWAFYAYYPAHLALIWVVLGAYS